MGENIRLEEKFPIGYCALCHEPIEGFKTREADAVFCEACKKKVEKQLRSSASA